MFEGIRKLLGIKTEKEPTFADCDLVLLGMGNPGQEYAKTRHNIGWMVLLTLIAKHGHAFSKGKGNYAYAKININGKVVLALLSFSYMNLSGHVIAKLFDRYPTLKDRLMIVVDEYNFPLGKIHIRKGGSDGGHNGVQSLISELGTDEFYRLRCGISKNFGAGELVNYVLSQFDEDEIPIRDQMLRDAVEALKYFIDNEPARAMSMINSGEIFKK